MGAPHTYSKAVHGETGWWGTFPLDLPIKIADIIQMDASGKIIRVGNVLNWPGWGVAMPIDSEPVNAATSWSRHAAKTRLGSAEGGATTSIGAGANAAIKVSFSEIGGFVLEYVAGKYHKLRDVAVAQKAVLGLAKNSEWNADHALVTEVTEANPATVLMSSARNTSVVLSAKAMIPGNIAAINLADPQFGFSASSVDSDVYQTVSQRAFPLYHCIRIRRKWWGGRYAELQAAAAAANLGEVFTDTPFDEDV